MTTLRRLAATPAFYSLVLGALFAIAAVSVMMQPDVLPRVVQDPLTAGGASDPLPVVQAPPGATPAEAAILSGVNGASDRLVDVGSQLDEIEVAIAEQQESIETLTAEVRNNATLVKQLIELLRSLFEWIPLLGRLAWLLAAVTVGVLVVAITLPLFTVTGSAFRQVRRAWRGDGVSGSLSA